MSNSNNLQHKSTTTILTVLIISIFLSSTFNQFISLSLGATPAEVGFKDGLSDCQTGTSNAINSHSNAGHHSAEYTAAYKRGLASCNNSKSNINNNINQGITGGNSVSSNGPLIQQQAAPPITPQQPPSNENNNTPQSSQTALDFNSICNTLQSGLYDSCNQLVNPNGSLNAAGNTTVKCIVTSAMLNVGATVLEIQPSFINNTLTNISDPTGCGGVVKIDQLNHLLTSTGNMKGIVNQLILLIQ